MSVEVDVVLPVLNEAASLQLLLPRMPSGYRPLVVDNASTDGSADIARRRGATVVREPVRGFGSACWAGLAAATAPVVAFMDADCSFDPAELPFVAERVLRGRSDLALAVRCASQGAWAWHARLANRALTADIRRRTGPALADLGPMRAAPRTALLSLGITDRRYAWPLEMVLRAHEGGWRVTEHPVRYFPRVGRSKVTGTVRGTVGAVRDMSRLLREIR